MRIHSLQWGSIACTAALGIAGTACFILVQGDPMSALQPRAVLKGSARHFRSVAFSPDSKLVAAGQQDGTIKIWETASVAEWLSIPGQNVSVAQFHASIFTLGFRPDGTTLAWASWNPKVPFLDLKTKKIVDLLEDPEDAVKMIRFSPCGKFLATTESMPKKGIVRLWDLETKKSRIVFDHGKSKLAPEKTPWIGDLAFSPDGKTLAVGVFGVVIFVDIAQASERRATQYYPHLITDLLYSRDGKQLVGWGKGITFWDAETGKELFSLDPKLNVGVKTPAFSPDGKTLAVGLNGGVHAPSYVQFWDVAQRRELGHFVCHREPVSQIAWSPDGKTLATASHDATVKLWDVATILKSFSK